VTASPAASRWTLLKHALLYGTVGGALIVVLQLARYRYIIFAHTFEVYAVVIAVVFVGVGLWLGATLTGRPERIVVQQVEVEVPVEVPVPAATTPFTPDPRRSASPSGNSRSSNSWLPVSATRRSPTASS
jgi:hypothetical protein